MFMIDERDKEYLPLIGMIDSILGGKKDELFEDIVLNSDHLRLEDHIAKLCDYVLDNKHLFSMNKEPLFFRGVEFAYHLDNLWMAVPLVMVEQYENKPNDYTFFFVNKRQKVKSANVGIKKIINKKIRTLGDFLNKRGVNVSFVRLIDRDGHYNITQSKVENNTMVPYYSVTLSKRKRITERFKEDCHAGKYNVFTN